MYRAMYFRGRRVNYSQAYPRVWWPEHPAAQESGLAAVHRIVAYEKWGDEVFGKQVHHVDEDPANWDADNLQLLTAEEHNWAHTVRPVERKCAGCGEVQVLRHSRRMEKETIYCGRTCLARGNEKISWPEDEVLLARLEDSNFSALARELGVSDNAIRKRLRARDKLN